VLRREYPKDCFRFFRGICGGNPHRLDWHCGSLAYAISRTGLWGSNGPADPGDRAAGLRFIVTRRACGGLVVVGALASGCAAQSPVTPIPEAPLTDTYVCREIGVRAHDG
jgi:hypothetical protein